jgi:hypothetical protein
MFSTTRVWRWTRLCDRFKFQRGPRLIRHVLQTVTGRQLPVPINFSIVQETEMLRRPGTKNLQCITTKTQGRTNRRCFINRGPVGTLNANLSKHEFYLSVTVTAICLKYRRFIGGNSLHDEIMIPRITKVHEICFNVRRPGRLSLLTASRTPE